MVRKGLLDEETSPVLSGSQYSYRLPAQVRQQLFDLEQTEEGKAWARELAPFESKAKSLLHADVKDLEYASTILFFHVQGDDWPEAVEKAIQFKGVPAVRNALGLAKQALT